MMSDLYSLFIHINAQMCFKSKNKVNSWSLKLNFETFQLVKVCNRTWAPLHTWNQFKNCEKHGAYFLEITCLAGSEEYKTIFSILLLEVWSTNFH